MLDKHINQKLAIYLDSLSAHKAKKVVAFAKENDIKLILSPIYSPDVNPIEWAFSKIKRVFKQLKLGCLVRGEEVVVRDLIKKAFFSILICVGKYAESKRIVELKSEYN